MVSQLPRFGLVRRAAPTTQARETFPIGVMEVSKYSELHRANLPFNATNNN